MKDDFLDTNDLWKLNLDEKNKQITSSKIKTVITNLLSERSKLRWIYCRILLGFWRTNTKLFHKAKKEATLRNSFYKVDITLILKLDKDTMKKLKLQINLNNDRGIFFNRMIANQTQECIKESIHHDQNSFIPEIQQRLVVWKSINVI